MVLLNSDSTLDEDREIPAAITDPGVERELNEDRYAVLESPSGLAWFVCDGVGGTTGGELAAQLAIDAMRRDLENQAARPPETALRSALLEANRVIVLRRQNLAFGQMGTTVVGAMFSGNQIILGHVGDSRAYLVRNRSIQQLTVDHTLVQELVDRGQIKSEEALSHPEAHVLTRCLGAEPGVKIDINRFWLWPTPQSDVLVMCSDGLYSLVNEHEISECVSTTSPQKACVRLVELAKARGGYDNITIAVIPLGGELREQPPEREPDLRHQSMKSTPLARFQSPTIFLVILLSVLAIISVGVLMFLMLGA